MSDFTIIVGTAWAGDSLGLMARVVGESATYITQASLSTITYKVYDPSLIGSPAPISSGSLTISSVVFDALQTDARWNLDSIGYNFRWNMPAGTLPLSNRAYRIEIKCTTTSGWVFTLVYQIST